MIIRIEPQSLQRVYDKNLGHAVLAWMAEHYDKIIPVLWEQGVSVSRSTSDLMIIGTEPQSFQRVIKSFSHQVT